MKTLFTLFLILASPAALAVEFVPSLLCTPNQPYGLSQIILLGEKPTGPGHITDIVFSSRRPDVLAYALVTNTDSESGDFSESGHYVIASRAITEGRRRDPMTYTFDFRPRGGTRPGSTSISVNIPSDVRRGGRSPLKLEAGFRTGSAPTVPFTCIRTPRVGPMPGPGMSGNN